MAIYLYLSMQPEALVASMLPPEEFGTYLAVGTKKRSRGQAMYFELDRSVEDGLFKRGYVEKRCVPHADGQPKHSVYLSVYRVLEQVPMAAIRHLYLTTSDGRVLRREPSDQLPAFDQSFHFYQEICPVQPRIVSRLSPPEFGRFITDPNHDIQVPRIFFVDLRLGELGVDPEHGRIRDLPYRAIEHLRDCIIQVRDIEDKHTKTVDRFWRGDFPFRTVQNGFYLADPKKFRYYPFPTEEELQTVYFEWWRSASM